MDPDTALYLLLDAIADNNRIEADKQLAILHRWIVMGGFMPKIELCSDEDGHFYSVRIPETSTKITR